jgi:hypothetical protein
MENLDYSTAWAVGETGLTSAEAAPSASSDGVATGGHQRVRIRGRVTAGSVTAMAWQLWTYGGGTVAWCAEVDATVADLAGNFACELAIDPGLTRFDWQLTAIAGGGTVAWDYRLV